MTPQYHHGDLPNALRAAAAEVITESGLGGFSLREVARRAGVSHAAPAHHFGDTTGLLTSLAVEAFHHLHDALALAVDSVDDPVERLIAIGRAYVSVGLTHPAHCQIMFRSDLVDAGNAEYMASTDAAFAVLENTLAEVAQAINPELDIEHAGKLCWAAMQGLVVLHENMTVLDERAGRVSSSPDDLVTSFTHLMINGLRAR